MTELHYSIDLAAHCQALSRMNPQGRDAAFLYREIASRVLDILQFMRMAPEKILYHTVGFDDGAKQLAKRYPDAEITVVSALPLSLSSCEPNSRIQYYCAKNLNLPFEKESFDLLVSNLMLHWQPNPSHYLKTCYLSLRARGLLLFSTLGPDTLHELHDAFSQVDEKPHIHEFIDMHHIGDALLHHQFIEPVMDMEQLTVHYRTLNRLFSDIKAIGAHNVHPERRRGLMGKKGWQTMKSHYARCMNKEGLIPATAEIIYGHAWMPEHKVAVQMQQQGEVLIPINNLTLGKDIPS